MYIPVRATIAAEKPSLHSTITNPPATVSNSAVLCSYHCFYVISGSPKYTSITSYISRKKIKTGSSQPLRTTEGKVNRRMKSNCDKYTLQSRDIYGKKEAQLN